MDGLRPAYWPNRSQKNSPAILAEHSAMSRFSVRPKSPRRLAATRCGEMGRLIELADLRDEVRSTHAVAPFVVVPAHHFEQVAAEHLREIGGENRAVRVADDIGRNDRVFRVLEDAL